MAVQCEISPQSCWKKRKDYSIQEILPKTCRIVNMKIKNHISTLTPNNKHQCFLIFN